MNIKRQTGLLYLYESVMCFRMTDVVWVLFLLGRGFSLAEVGIAEGVFHITSMICEVPSGMAADLLGRRKTLMLSGAAGMLSGIFMAADSGMGFVFAGMIFSALCFNLASGTEEAMTYDSLLEAGCPQRFKKVSAGMNVAGAVTGALSCMFSPLAVALGYRYTYGISVLLHGALILVVAGMKEPAITEMQKNRGRYRAVDFGVRLANHVRDTFDFIRHHPRTMGKLFANAGIACPCYLIMMYLQEHLVNCGWPERWIGLPMLAIPLARAFGTWLASRCETGLFRAVLLCGILGGIGTCFTGGSVLAVVLAGACLARVCEGFCAILISENVNRDFTSDQRATLISVDSMLYSVLMVAASPLTGFLGSRYSVPVIFYMLGAVMAAAAAVLGFFYNRKVLQPNMSQKNTLRRRRARQ